MRITAITPMHVGAAEVARRQARYDRLAPQGLAISVVDLPDRSDTPRALETADDIRASERLVVEVARQTDPATADAIMPDCVLDPGLPELERDSPLLVLGITRLVVGLLGSLGRRFAAVTRNDAIGAELAAVIGRYGWADAFSGVAVLGLSVADITDEARWNQAVTRAANESAPLKSAAVIVNGCSAVEVNDVGTGVPLVDPTALALRLASIAGGLLSTGERS